MKLKKNLRGASYTKKAPSEWARRQVLLAATAFDERHEYWALEFFEHREQLPAGAGCPGAPFAKSSRQSTRCQLNFREGLRARPRGSPLCP